MHCTYRSLSSHFHSKRVVLCRPFDHRCLYTNQLRSFMPCLISFLFVETHLFFVETHFCLKFMFSLKFLMVYELVSVIPLTQTILLIFSLIYKLINVNVIVRKRKRKTSLNIVPVHLNFPTHHIK